MRLKISFPLLLFVVSLVCLRWLFLAPTEAKVSSPVQEDSSPVAMIDGQTNGLLESESDTRPDRSYYNDNLQIARTLTLIELGANNGMWTAQKCKEYKPLIDGKVTEIVDRHRKWRINAFKCYIFEANPEFDSKLSAIAKDCGCEVIQKIVSDKDDVKTTFSISATKGGIGSSVFDGGVYTEGGTLVSVKSVDIVNFLQQKVDPRSRVWMRMDIEGSEYSVIRRMINARAACEFVDYLEFEGHAMYQKALHKYRPVDAVVPWLLRACGVEVAFETYYGKAHRDKLVIDKWPKDDKCTPEVCPVLYVPIQE